MHFLINHLVNTTIEFLLSLNSFLVSQTRRPSVSKFHVDNFRRPELNSWLLPSEKQPQNHRPFSEQNENNRISRLRTFSDENDLSKNRRQATNIG